MLRIKVVSAIFMSLVLTNTAFATSVNSCSGINGDFGDAPASYGTACHDTNRWQQLGSDGANGDTLLGDTGSGSSENNGWSSETTEENVDAGDNGVQWRTHDGSSWSGWGTSGVLTRGQEVQFRFEVKRSTEGNHKYDWLKAWVDWSGNKSFNDTNDSSDELIDRKWWKHKNANNTTYSGNRDGLGKSSNFYNDDLERMNSPDEFKVFKTSRITVPLDAAIGETWMRARVICENSLNHTNNNYLAATGYMHQGEAEDYKLRIVGGSTVVTPVPEPSTLLILSTALFGFIRSRKKSA